MSSANPTVPAGDAALPLSLVITTLGRVDEVVTLFDSLVAQTFTAFEVIVVDQNGDDRLAATLGRTWPFPVHHIHTPAERGASRGRNHGWKNSRGAVVLFPDDDCWYAPRFLETSLAAMEGHGCDVLAGRATNGAGKSIMGRFAPTARPITRANVWTTAIEWMVFFRRPVLEATNGFNEDVGVGASTPWQSAEIQDIIIRAMTAGFSCWYDPTVIGFHKETVSGTPDARVKRKARVYGRGIGYVLRLHGYRVPTMAIWAARPLVGGIIAAARGRWAMLPYQGQVALGRLEGVLGRTLERD